MVGSGGWWEREFFIDNLLVRIHRCFWCTGLAPWEFESPFPGSLISTFLEAGGMLTGIENGNAHLTRHQREWKCASHAHGIVHVSTGNAFGRVHVCTGTVFLRKRMEVSIHLRALLRFVWCPRFEETVR